MMLEVIGEAKAPRVYVSRMTRKWETLETLARLFDEGAQEILVVWMVDRRNADGGTTPIELGRFHIGPLQSDDSPVVTGDGD